MPRGVKGSLTHSASAYRRGACREACCREHHRVDAANKRAAGKMGMNSGAEIPVVAQGTRALLTGRQAEILQAWMKDGADRETVGRRTGIGGARASKVLTMIQQAYGFSNRVELAIALERGLATYEVVTSDAPRRDVAA